MSVVNKMLQDLEARENEACSLSADYQPAAKKTLSPIVGGLAVVAILLAAGIYFYPQIMAGHNASAASPQGTESRPAKVEAPSKPVETPIKQQNVATQGPGQVTQHGQMTTVEQQPVPALSDKEDVVTPGTNNDVVETLSEIADSINAAPVETHSASAVDNVSAATLEPTSNPEQENSKVFSVSSSQADSSKQSLRELVQYALKNGEEQEAISLLYRLLESEPDNIGARKKLAAMLFARGQLNEAEVLLSQGMQRQPDNLQIRLMLARLYFQKNALEQAFDTMKSDKVSAFLYPDYVSFRASLAEKVARYDIARQDYQALVESQPDEPRWWLGFAVSLERLNENMLALEAYEKTNNLGQLPDEVMQFVKQRIRYLTGS